MKTAVVLFNLGGPDGPAAIQPFLFNLFSDPAILRLPAPVRWPLAQLISRLRARTARAIYGRMGGRSPILPNTEAQAAALSEALADLGPVRVFIAMRYWHPMAAETAAAVHAYGPDRVVLLPLYPQWSTTTTASSLRVWRAAWSAVGGRAAEHTVCCYPTETGLIEALAAGVSQALVEAARHGAPRVLFSAHGLPKRVVAAGDPYAWQCEATVAAVVARLARPGLDWSLCYQSRVGPLEWIGPSTEAEIERAAHDRVPLVVVPIAFVSEHSETLVELDQEYRALALAGGVPYYGRVPAVAVHPAFIAGLAGLVRSALERGPGLAADGGPRRCPAGYCGCAQASPIGAPG